MTTNSPENHPSPLLAGGEVDDTTLAGALWGFLPSLSGCDSEDEEIEVVRLALIEARREVTKPEYDAMRQPQDSRGEVATEPRQAEIHCACWDGTLDGLRALAEWAGSDPTGDPQFSWMTTMNGWCDPMLGEEGIAPGDLFAEVDGWVLPLRLPTLPQDSVRGGERVLLARVDRNPPGDWLEFTSDRVPNGYERRWATLDPAPEGSGQEAGASPESVE